jgi:hypothetical protein
MKLPALFRRRHVWVPTVWAWLVVGLACGVGALLGVRHLYAFLAPNAPAGARILIVEGWMPADELDQALRAYERGHYERVVTTGGPIIDPYEHLETGSYAVRARDYLVKNGVPADDAVAVPAPASAQDRSFLNAVMLRDWIARSDAKVDTVDLFSSGVHSRRSWLLHRMAFGPQVRVGILAATPSSYDPEAWWRTSGGAKEVLGEALGWLWTELFFHPAPPGSQQERWGVSE